MQCKFLICFTYSFFRSISVEKTPSGKNVMAFEDKSLCKETTQIQNMIIIRKYFLSLSEYINEMLTKEFHILEK